MSLPNTGSLVPVAVAPRKPNSGTQSFVVPRAMTAATMKDANHGALLGNIRQWPAQRPQIVADEDADREKHGDEDPGAKPKRQPIAVALAEFLEPVVLQRYRHDRLETDDSEHSRCNVSQVAIKSVSERNRRTARFVFKKVRPSGSAANRMRKR